MKLDAEDPRLLLFASLCCTFSVVAVLSHFASQAPASATSRPAGAAAPANPWVEPALRPAGERQGADASESQGGEASEAPLQKVTLNPHGPGLLPTAAPGGLVPAEAEAETPAAEDSRGALGAPGGADESGDAAQATTGSQKRSEVPRMPRPRRPGSSGVR